MIRNNQGKLMVGLLVVVVLAAIISVVFNWHSATAAQLSPGQDNGTRMAQVPGGQFPGGPGAPPPPGPGMPGWGPGAGRIPGPMMPGGGPAAIAATGQYVYVVQGNTLYQFTANPVKLVSKTEIQEMPKPPAGAPPAPGY